MARVKPTKQKSNNGANVGYEAELWQMADALRGSMDAAEYKHVVLGLIFLKYISDAFEEQHAKLVAEEAQGADPEDQDEYRALNIFWVPPEARWPHLKSQAKQPTIGELADTAMTGIERDNPSLKSVLPKDYARPGLDKQRLGQLIDMISNIHFSEPSPPAPLPEGEGRREPAVRLRDRRGEVLFIDTRKMGRLVDRTHRELTDEEIRRIASTYHAWRSYGPQPVSKGEEHYRGGFDFSRLLQTARELRKKQTPAESVMWELLRDRRFMSLKFRRQHQVGDYVVDFYCDEKKLALEMDGPVHEDASKKKHDHKRDAYLQSIGLRVLRFRNEDILENPQDVLDQIAAAAIHPSPIGRGAGGEGNPGIRRYADVPGFCKSATLDDIRKHGHVLTPGRYVGAEAQEDDGEPFEEKMKRLTATLQQQMQEGRKLDDTIAANLKELGYGG